MTIVITNDRSVTTAPCGVVDSMPYPTLRRTIEEAFGSHNDLGLGAATAQR